MQVTRSDVPGGWGQHISLFCARRLAKADQTLLISESSDFSALVWSRLVSGVSTSEFTDFVLFGKAISVVNKSLDFV